MAFLDEQGLAYFYNKIKVKLSGLAPFVGATSGTAGASGLVPVPAAGTQSKVLRGDGTWGDCGSADTLKGVAPSVNGAHRFPFIPVIQGDGVMEVGNHIDFHDASGESADYSTRLTGSGTGLSIGTNVTISSLTFAANGTNGYMEFDSGGIFNFPNNAIYCQGGRLVRDTEFPLYSNTAGWIRFVGGLIIAWGRITKAGSAGTYFTYPRGFGDVFGAWACMVSGGSSNYANNGAFCRNVSTTGCNVYANSSESSEFRILIIGRE